MLTFEGTPVQGTSGIIDKLTVYLFQIQTWDYD